MTLKLIKSRFILLSGLFTALGLTILASFCWASTAPIISCQQLVTNNWRTEHAAIAQAIRQKRTDPTSANLINGYIKNNFAKIQEKIKPRLQKITSPNVNEAAKKLEKISARYFKAKSLDMQTYNRLIILYSQLFDFLQAKDLNEFITVYDLHLSKETEKSRRISLLHSDKKSIEEWLYQTSNSLLSNTNSTSTSLYEMMSTWFDKGWVTLPTFKDFGFRSILYGMSRGVLYVGQTDKSKEVDGNTYLPSTFTDHDFFHALPFGLIFYPYEPSGAQFWDNLEAQVDIIKEQDTHLAKIIEGLLFFAFHESNASRHFRMSCEEQLRPDGETINEFLKDYKDLVLMSRFNDHKDFGQGFRKEVLESEINQAIKDVSRLIDDACP